MASLMKIFGKQGLAVAAIFGLIAFAAQTSSAETAPPKNKKEKIGYAVGANIARDMKKYSIDIDAEMVLQGMNDAKADRLKLSEEEIRTTLTDLTKEMRTKHVEMVKTLGEKNKKDGEEFLSKNAKAPGVTKLPSGVQYKVIKTGTGKTPAATDTVLVHYRGTLLDGTEFDSSYKKNQPAEFKVNAVIPGWTEILQKMKAGSKYTVYIPSSLAYGEKGNGIIGPNAVLTFDVELISIK